MNDILNCNAVCDNSNFNSNFNTGMNNVNNFNDSTGLNHLDVDQNNNGYQSENDDNTSQ